MDHGRAQRAQLQMGGSAPAGRGGCWVQDVVANACGNGKTKTALAGFTLIEVIVAIVLSAIAMAAILPFLGNVFLQSYEPRTQLGDGLALQTAMERLVSRFSTNDLATLHAQVAAEVAAYPGGIGLATNEFVQFTVGGQEIAAGGTNNLLKITLQNGLGETATRLFAEPL